MGTTRRLASALAAVLCNAAAAQEAQFVELDFHANAVSDDGRVVVGSSDASAVLWSEESGIIDLGDLPPPWVSSYLWATSVSADGRTVAGWAFHTWLNVQAFIWTPETGMVGLGYMHGDIVTRALGISADGEVVVGNGWTVNGNEAFRWTVEAGFVALGDLPGGTYDSEALGISSDGSILVGRGVSDKGFEAFIWSEETGMIPLGDLKGGEFASAANDVSDDGGVVVGRGTVGNEYATQAFAWTPGGGMVTLAPMVDGSPARGEAFAVTGDGSLVAGTSSYIATIWTDLANPRSLQDLLETDYGLDLNGWALRVVTGMSRDGRTLIGWGLLDGHERSWLARLGPICPADCTADGTADLFDFLCFVNLFNAGDPAADCSGDEVLDLFDFLCFVNTFNDC